MKKLLGYTLIFLPMIIPLAWFYSQEGLGLVLFVIAITISIVAMTGLGVYLID